MAFVGTPPHDAVIREYVKYFGTKGLHVNITPFEEWGGGGFEVIANCKGREHKEHFAGLREAFDYLEEFVKTIPSRGKGRRAATTAPRFGMMVHHASACRHYAATLNGALPV